MSRDKFRRRSEVLQQFLEKMAKETGIMSGFEKRRRELRGEVFAKTWVLGNVAKPAASLNELAQGSAALGAAVGPQAISQRVNEGRVAFFEALLVKGLDHFHNAEQIPEAVLRQLAAVYLIDSSQMTLPPGMAAAYPGNRTGRGKAMLKLEVAMNYLSGMPQAMSLQAGRRPDQRSPLPVARATADRLIITDLGYFNMETFDQINARQAYFLSRL